ncbi:7SK snRNA methylphosphate capping enzyme [Nymphon striatum]|nr:7SK snRNA methylphosphate capping enzyme [Nymphon striatum]
MASGIAVSPSNASTLRLEEKYEKSVTFKFNETLTLTMDRAQKNKDNKSKCENRNPKRPNHYPRHDTYSRINEPNEPSYNKSGKRRYSASSVDFKAGGKRRRHNNKDPELKFLMGGDISDPLNLKSLENEEINRRVNAPTPVSSPMPTPKQKIDYIIPLNVADPLALNNVNQNFELTLSPARKKKHKRSRVKSCGDEAAIKTATDRGKECDEHKDKDESNSDSKPKILHLRKKVEDIDSDKIVSPVIIQGPMSIKSRKKSKEGFEFERPDSNFRFRRRSGKRHHSGASNTSSSSCHIHFNAKDKDFQYGNYSRYYGYRNHKLDSDQRLKCLKKEWIEGKDVLDIGCNVGHITLTVAKEFSPRKIIGIDIDEKLIQAANKNVKYYVTSQLTSPHEPEDFPRSLVLTYGPIVASAVLPSLLSVGNPVRQYKFPHNVSFVEGNYVLESDDQLEKQNPEFDLIFALSLTKWVHLNFGDAGLKRLFKRIFNQLRPGGKLLLEAQTWPSYAKKKKLTERIHKNYLSIQFKPEQFTEYLLSKNVGFSTCEVIDTPQNPSKVAEGPYSLTAEGDYSRSHHMLVLINRIYMTCCYAQHTYSPGFFLKLGIPPTFY